MAGVGFPELVLLFVIGLLILGPERLPRVATQIGRWVGRARRTANQLRYQLEREIALADIEKKSQDKKPQDKKPQHKKPQDEKPRDGGSNDSGQDGADRRADSGSDPDDSIAKAEDTHGVRNETGAAGAATPKPDGAPEADATPKPDAAPEPDRSRTTDDGKRE